MRISTNTSHNRLNRVKMTVSILLMGGLSQAATQGLLLTVHEWGTFTTLTTSEGKPLPDLFIDASPLPNFVNTLPFFAGAPAPLHLGMQSEPMDKNCAAKWKHVYTKMETPVLYFYHDWNQPLNVEVKAKFPGGTIHQFFPPRDSGEINPATSSVDFAEKQEGSITWKAEILPETLTTFNDPRLTQPDGGNSQEWLAPRRPHSNLVRAGGAVESYLFYRGLSGEQDLPLKIRFLNASTLELSNTGSDTISNAIVYDQSYENLIRAGMIWWQGSINPGETLRLPIDTTLAAYATSEREPAFQKMKQNLQTALVKAGLSNDEASAMLNTWERSYWGDEMGFKVFWIVPRKTIDKLVPLELKEGLGICNIQLNRVFIARSEILTPAFEQQLKAGKSVPIQDRHRMAYAAYLATPTSIRLNHKQTQRDFLKSHYRHPMRQQLKSIPLVLPNGRQAGQAGEGHNSTMLELCPKCRAEN